MKYRITILAGVGFFADGSAIPDSVRIAAVGRIEAYAADKFGGLTIREHKGSWKDSSGNVISESGVTFEVLADDPFQGNPDVSPALRAKGVQEQGNAFATFTRSALQQNSVVLTVEPLPYAVFVDGSRQANGHFIA